MRNNDHGKLKNMTTRGKSVLLVVLVGAGGILLYPFKMNVVPEWRVRVVDQERTPLRRVEVTEYWSHLSVELDDHQADSTTDDEGYVTFPARSIRVSLLRRGIYPFIKVLRHDGEYGPSAYLIAAGDINHTTVNGFYRPGRPLPEEVVRRRDR